MLRKTERSVQRKEFQAVDPAKLCLVIAILIPAKMAAQPCALTKPRRERAFQINSQNAAPGKRVGNVWSALAAYTAMVYQYPSQPSSQCTDVSSAGLTVGGEVELGDLSVALNDVVNQLQAQFTDRHPLTEFLNTPSR